MDVDSLKAELEEHLAKNPDEHAPGGFRDRFDLLVEQYQADDGDVPKSVLEAELQQIRSEAEAAWSCCATPHAEEAPPRAEAVEIPADPGGPISAPADDVDPPASGLMRYGLALVAALVILAAAYYFFRR
jgi:hypothetical protein